MDFTTIAYALLSGILPALLWLWFWLKEDNLHPEPRSLIVVSFISGMIVVVFAIFLEKFVADLISDENIRYILWAGIEEIVKFFAVGIIALGTTSIDEPIDAMIYGITVALGFAAIENTLFVFSQLNTGEITKSIITGNMRFLGATLVHVVSSASIGLMIGISFYKDIFVKTISVIFGVILAVALHSAFNLSIINATGSNTLKIFGWVWCSVVILLIIFEEVKAIKPKIVN
jgi:RsiW-degrading membrane proteinase PrsW (M82 family)